VAARIVGNAREKFAVRARRALRRLLKSVTVGILADSFKDLANGPLNAW
jgi:hypothetical protein